MKRIGRWLGILACLAEVACRPSGSSGAPAHLAATLPSASAAPAIPDAAVPVAAAPSLEELQHRYGPMLYEGMRRLRVTTRGGEEHLVGDNEDPHGMQWTKCGNLGIDLMVTLVAEKQQLVSQAEAALHVDVVLRTLASVESFRGIFPEVIELDPAPAHAKVVGGKLHYSSIDSAWATLAVSLVEARYASTRPDLASQARALLAKQDYAVFVGTHGFMGAGIVVDSTTKAPLEALPFAYDDRNSEARPLVLALLAMGKVPASAWDNLRYEWGSSQGLTLAKGWNFSAFVEMTGALFFDEAALAPATLGFSHANYLEATVRVAKAHGHQVFGYAPGCDAVKGYSEFGLDRPDVAFPYAAGELLMTGDPRARSNVDRMLGFLPKDGRPLPDAVLPSTGAVYCPYARTLDQGLLFLSLYASDVQGLVRGTAWYPAAASLLRAFDRVGRPPG